MDTQVAPEAMMQCRVSPSWTVVIPASFTVSADDDEAYWQGADQHRLVATTALLAIGPEGPAPASVIAAALRSTLDGIVGAVPVRELPPGLVGWAVIAPALQPAVAGTTLSGVLVTDGNALAVTITADDLDWIRRTWRTIQFDAPGPPWPHRAGLASSHHVQ